MNAVAIEDVNYLAKQSTGRINMILSGMTALMNDTEAKVATMESQDWFQRMVKTVTGKNKLTQIEILKNHDKLNAYMSEAIAELYNRNCIDHEVMMSLGTQLNELYADQLQLKQMLGVFVGKLNEKIDSVDNFHMLTTEISQGVYAVYSPIVAVCKVISKFDKRIIEDDRKLDILKRSLMEQNIINNVEVPLTDYLMSIMNVPVEEMGQIYLELGTIRGNFMSNIILGMAEKYHFLPDMAMKMKNKKALIDEMITEENLDASVVLTIYEIYEDFVKSKIDVISKLIPMEEIQSDLNSKAVKNGYDDAQVRMITQYSEKQVSEKSFQEESERHMVTEEKENGNAKVMMDHGYHSRGEVNTDAEKDKGVLRKSDEEQGEKLIKKYLSRLETFEAIKLECELFAKTHGKGRYEASQKLRKHLGLQDEVYLGYDDTIFQSGKNGFAITESGIYHRDTFLHTDHISFEELSDGEKINMLECYIYVDERKLATVSLTTDEEKEDFKGLFERIHMMAKYVYDKK